MSVPALVSPLPTLDAQQVARLAEATAGLSAQQLIWASGYLAGLAAQPGATAAQSAVSAAEAARPTPLLTIFFGSQTGNSRRVAETAAARAEAAGLATKLVNLADYSPRQLRQETLALFVVSTQGDGDPPEDAAAFYEFLTRASAPRLERLRYGVLALGDSSYPRFCQTGRVLDERLAELGAQRLLARVDCDLDFAAAAETWTANAITETGNHLKATSAPRISLVETRTAAVTTGSDMPYVADAELLVQQRLTGRHSSKDVRHLEFAVDLAQFPYVPGDGLAVSPVNPHTAVDAMLEVLGVTAEHPVPSRTGEPRALASVLAEELEITLVGRPLVAAIQARTEDPALAALLKPGAEDALQAFLATHQVADVLRLAGGRLELAEALALLRPLARRTYSIASSPLASPDEVHLLVGLVAEDHGSGLRMGAASSWLAGLSPGTSIKAHLEVNKSFHLPGDEVPLIMIGPGTGVAPFRAYVAERAARGARGRNWLFFGERTRREDFLYQTEWQKALAQGTLNRLDVAFSREKQGREYVQHRLLAQAADVFAWLEEGAAIHVCGDAKRMAKDVHATLIAIIQKAGGRDEDDARDYLQTLQRDGRYRRDVY